MHHGRQKSDMATMGMEIGELLHSLLHHGWSSEVSTKSSPMANEAQNKFGL